MRLRLRKLGDHQIDYQQKKLLEEKPDTQHSHRRTHVRLRQPLTNQHTLLGINPRDPGDA